MIFYIIFYLFSVFLSLIASKQFKKNNKTLGIIFSIFAILVPSIISGLRTENIGTDTSKYVSNTFNAALYGENYKDSFEYMNNASNVEYLYKLINFIFSRITNNINWIYFFMALLTTTFIYVACYNNRTENDNYSFAYFSFLILFFNRSFNLSRQSLAVAMIIYASKFIFEKKFGKYLFWCIIASGIHSIAIFFVSLYFLVKYINGNAKTIKKILVLVLALIFVSQYQNILLLMINEFGLLDKRYLFYVIDYSNKGTNIILIELAFMAFIVFLLVIYRKKINNEKIKTYSMFVLLAFIIYLVGIYANYAFRLSYYLYGFVIFVNQYLLERYKQKSNRAIIEVITSIAICFYAYLYYDVNKFDQTVPYKSIISEEVEKYEI